MSFLMVALEEVVQPVERAEIPSAGTIYRQVGVKLWGVGAYERESIDGSQTRYKTFSRIETDDIIVNKIWARNGSVAVVPKNLAGCYVSSEFPTFVPIRDKLEPRWFHWLTKTKFFWEKCDEKSQGTSGKNRIRPERFLEIEIPLPPLLEQRRIVARIEEFAAKIVEARGLRREAGIAIEKLHSTLMQDIFTHLVDTPVMKIMKLSTKVTKGTTPKTYGYPFSETGVPFLRAEEVQDGNVNWNGTPYRISEETNEFMSRSKTEPRDVLITIAGVIGRCGVVSKDAPQLNMNQAVALVRTTDELDPYYLSYFVRSPQGQSHIKGQTVTTAISNISLQTIRDLQIPIPPRTAPHRRLPRCASGKGGRAQAPPDRDRRRTGCADAGGAGQGV